MIFVSAENRKMPRKCIVPGCVSNESSNVRFYRFPSIKSSLPNLSRQRFLKWIKILGFRSHFNSANKFVCSLHFVTGKCAKDTDTSDIDWAPTLNISKAEKSKTHLPIPLVSDRANSSVSDHTNYGIGSNNTGLNSCMENGQSSDGLDEIRYEEFATQLMNNEPSTANLQSTLLECPSNSQMNERDMCVISDVIPNTTSSDIIHNERCEEIKEIENHSSNCCFSGNDCSMVQKYRLELAELQKRISQLEVLVKRGLDWISNDERTKLYTGIDNFKTFKRIYDYVEGSLFKPSCNLTKDQVFVMTLRKLRRGTPFVDLAEEYSVCINTVSKYFHRTIYVMYCSLKYALEPPSKDKCIRHLPRLFRETLGDKRVFIIDCFEVSCETPSDPKAANSHHSFYKMQHTVKFLIAMSPHGVVCFISNAFVGRCSDRFIAQNSGFINVLEPGDVVLANKGFDFADLIAQRGATLNIPTFLKKQQQLNLLDIEKGKQITSLRVHVERIIGVLKMKYEYLRGMIEATTLRRFENNTNAVDIIVKLCCILINLNYPIT